MASELDVDVGILLYGDSRLRRPARPVTPGEDLGDLPERLCAAMLEAEGIGLAANQLGDERRVIAVRDPAERGTRPLVLVNPAIMTHRGPMVSFEEGCLSFPGVFLTLVRPRGVEVAYLDLAGRPQTLRNEGILARVIQHEVDHLDGKLFIDHLPRWRRWSLSARLGHIRRRGKDARRVSRERREQA
jgi:peptide deformylase